MKQGKCENAPLAITDTEATWTSVFDAPCWVSSLYFSAPMSGKGDWEFRNGTHDEGSRSEDICRCPEDTAEIRKEKQEVLGWTFDSCARGVTVMGTAVFVSSDLLRLAKEAAGCIDPDEECTGRIYGMRPSSILTNIVMLVGLLSAFVMPLIGAVIDHTNYRRAVGSLSAGFMAVTILLQMLIMEDYWFIAAILQIVVAFSYTVHLCAVYAYLPELTSDHEKLTEYTTRFTAAQYLGSVAFLLIMIGILSTVNRDDRFSATLLSQSLVFSVCFVLFGYAWTVLFQPRPASQQVPSNESLVSAGFRKIYKTAQTILLHHSAIKWFLVSVAFTEAATTAFTTIAITYMTEMLGFSAKENGIAILILLIFGVPGARIAAYLSATFNPIRSLQLNLIFWICSIVFASLLLYKPDQHARAYLFAVVWGLSIGWVYPTEKTLYVTIIPRGQEAELMGTYICCCQILSWLPPLIFSAMNETGFSLQIGLATLSLYFLTSLCILFFVGDYGEAVLHAKNNDKGCIPFTVNEKEDMGAAIGACYEQFTEETMCDPGGSTLPESDRAQSEISRNNYSSHRI